MKYVVFHHVGLSWMIHTMEKVEFAVDEYFTDLCTQGPWYNVMICHNLHGTVFEYLFLTVLQNRYKLMCGLNAYVKFHENSSLSK